MEKTKRALDNVIPFPADAVRKFGLERVRERKPSRLEAHGQLNLFDPPSAQVVPFRRPSGPFEEALLLDERGGDGAAEAYRRAIEAGDCVADAYCNLGVLESKRGSLGEAFDCFTQSLRHDPGHFESHYDIGNLYFDVEDYRLSRVHYEIAISIDPDFPNTYFNLGLAHALAQDFESAVDALSRYRELAPGAEAGKTAELLDCLRKLAGAPSRGRS